jgi:hypothetical protein
LTNGIGLWSKTVADYLNQVPCSTGDWGLLERYPTKMYSSGEQKEVWIISRNRDFFYDNYMAPRRQHIIAVLLSLHPRVGQESLISSLKEENILRILEMAMLTDGLMPMSRSGTEIGGVILLSGADSSLISLMGGQQVGRSHKLALRHRLLPSQQAVERRPPVRVYYYVCRPDRSW